jgi:hypothetical protein
MNQIQIARRNIHMYDAPLEHPELNFFHLSLYMQQGYIQTFARGNLA